MVCNEKYSFTSLMHYYCSRWLMDNIFIFFITGARKSNGSRGTYASRTALCSSYSKSLHDKLISQNVQRKLSCTYIFLMGSECWMLYHAHSTHLFWFLVVFSFVIVSILALYFIL